MKRIGGLILVFLGIALAAFGIIRGTTGEDSTRVQVTIPGGEHQMIYTVPGVLSLVDNTVDVTLTVPDGTVQWGVGSTQDVEAFIGDGSVVKVTGLADWETPAFEERAGDPEDVEGIASSAAEGNWNLHVMDMWFESGTGEGTAQFTLEPDQSVEQSLIASSSLGIAPDMTLSWNRALVMVNPVPWVVIGILTAIIGVLFVLSAGQDAAVNKKRAVRLREKLERQEAATSVMTKVDQPRVAAAAASGGALGAAVLPGVNEEIRERELSDADRLLIQPTEETGDKVEATAPDSAEPDSAALEGAAPEETALEGKARAGTALAGTAAVSTTPESAAQGATPAADTGATPDESVAQDSRVDVVEGLDSGEQGAQAVGQTQPEGEAASGDDTAGEDDTSREGDSAGEGDIQRAAADSEPDEDWRSLWNFSWGTPWKKGEDNA